MFERYAVFYTPTGALADFGAAWLGWDSAAARSVTQLDLTGVDVARLTKGPRKYGFHGTLKAPFRLAPDVAPRDLQTAVAAFATRHAAFDIGALELSHSNGFLALRPTKGIAELQDLAAMAVKAFDPFRAPLSESEIARRSRAPLTARQHQQMLNWGYPHIFEDFQFHLTLTGRVAEREAETIIAALKPLMAPISQHGCQIESVTLMGQDSNGIFHQIHRYLLIG